MKSIYGDLEKLEVEIIGSISPATSAGRRRSGSPPPVARRSGRKEIQRAQKPPVQGLAFPSDGIEFDCELAYDAITLYECYWIIGARIAMYLGNRWPGGCPPATAPKEDR